jgi:hypothetical protein
MLSLIQFREFQDVSEGGFNETEQCFRTLSFMKLQENIPCGFTGRHMSNPVELAEFMLEMASQGLKALQAGNMESSSSPQLMDDVNHDSSDIG